MANRPKWKRGMNPMQRLEYEIQNAYKQIVLLADQKGFINEKWRQGMLRYWAKVFKANVERWRELNGEGYNVLRPIWFDLLGIRQGRWPRR